MGNLQLWSDARLERSVRQQTWQRFAAVIAIAAVVVAAVHL
jgi:hypothetical protein